MLQLLAGKSAPLTFSIGFLERPLSAIEKPYLEWLTKNYDPIESCSLEGDLAHALQQLEPLTMPRRRELLLATDSAWTAYFDNSITGPDPLPRISYLSMQLHCRGLTVACVPHTLNTETGNARGTYGAVQFELFGPTLGDFLNHERSVSVAYEAGKWRFDANGPVQPFEEVKQYSARKIKERFTPEMLQRYCESLGIRLFDDSFYSGPGLLVELRNRLVHEIRELTLSEARQEMGLL